MVKSNFDLDGEVVWLGGLDEAFIRKGGYKWGNTGEYKERGLEPKEHSR